MSTLILSVSKSFCVFKPYWFKLGCFKNEKNVLLAETQKIPNRSNLLAMLPLQIFSIPYNNRPV